MLMATRRMPLSTMAWATRSSMSVPLVASATGRPWSRGVRRDLENVGTKQRFAAGQDENRFGERGEVADKQQRFLGGKIVLHELLAHVEAAAMNALQIATRRGLPKKEPEFVVVFGFCDHSRSMV